MDEQTRAYAESEKPSIKRVLAVDLGASSGRVMLAAFDGIRLELREIHRFDNMAIEERGSLYWDVEGLLKEIKVGIRLAAEDQPILGIGVDTWGVDYGWIGQDGALLRKAHHYRDARMGKHAAELERLLPRVEQFKLTGNQPDVINTVYQLFSDLQEAPELRERASSILMMPDLFHYELSGVKASERTIWSTSGLLTAGGSGADTDVLTRLDIPSELIVPIVPAGTVLGELRPDLQAELRCGPMRVIAGASHDTASAVASVPYKASLSAESERNSESAAFISCGTWSIAGIETSRPVVSEAAFERGFTNEACYGGGNRLLKNITGLWLLQECRKHWNAEGENFSHTDLVSLAEAAGPADSWIDPNDPRFSAPGDMPERVRQYCRDTGQPVPDSPGEIARLVLESLADAYGRSIDELEVVSGRAIAAVHLVGGGSRNALLCRLTAQRTGRSVISGPVEASAAGSALIQLAALGELDFARRADIIERSFTLERFEPHSRTN
ncbi:rhamnulokinase [Saccharibacillus endophyticus]|uniref:Carbohydrate kinase n=1 Tax=Saccharibacillus endophyticus TaxID=2060666 RepID=A0ABQ1ZUS0_9BACL|nr:rhamnulokinase family protein [Saccharibacillus endophyticus]GGH78208.1 carbohydrate kinase [Saccharibacillus endophyticus]